MFESERTVEILSEIWILWRERSQKQKKAGPAYRCVSESRHIFCNVYIQEKIIKIIQNIRRKKRESRSEIKSHKGYQRNEIHQNDLQKQFTNKHEQKSFTENIHKNETRKSDSQKWFTEMIHRNDSQKWFTKMTYKNDSQNNSQKSKLQKRLTKNYSKKIHKHETHKNDS